MSTPMFVGVTYPMKMFVSCYDGRHIQFQYGCYGNTVAMKGTFFALEIKLRLFFPEILFSSNKLIFCVLPDMGPGQYGNNVSPVLFLLYVVTMVTASKCLWCWQIWTEYENKHILQHNRHCRHHDWLSFVTYWVMISPT